MAWALIAIPLVYLWLLKNFGWRGSDLVLGLAIWAVMLPLIIGLLRDRPEDVGQALDGLRPGDTCSALAAPAVSGDWGFTMGEALCSSAGWIVACGTASYSLIHTAVFF